MPAAAKVCGNVDEVYVVPATFHEREAMVPSLSVLVSVNVHVSDEQVCVNEATGAALLPPVLTSVGENVDTSSSGSLVPSPESSVQL